MKDSEINNPSAFARPASNPEYSCAGSQEGMTLRDFMAAAALQGIIASGNPILMESEQAAKIAYRFADSMLDIRKR